MRTTVVARLADQLGAIRQEDGWRHGRHGPELQWRHAAYPAARYAERHPARVPVDVGHDGCDVGVVRLLARRDGCVWAVAEIDQPERVPADCGHVSPLLATRGDGLLEVRGVSLVEHPATVAPLPVRTYVGAIADVARRLPWRDRSVQAELVRAAAANRDGTTRLDDDEPAFVELPNGPTLLRATGEPITARTGNGATVQVTDQRSGTVHRLPIRHRPAGRVLSVR